MTPVGIIFVYCHIFDSSSNGVRKEFFGERAKCNSILIVQVYTAPILNYSQ